MDACTSARVRRDGWIARHRSADARDVDVELRVIIVAVNTVNWAYVDTRSVSCANAGLGNNVGHDIILQLYYVPEKTPCI
jgi:hypothetical protein